MPYLKEYEKWINGPIDGGTRRELNLIADDHDEIKSRFYAPLKFGTGGLRGIIGAGIGRMNIYTVRRAAQGMASLILRQKGRAEKRGVVIAYDCRNFSREFAQESACVCAANGIQVYFFDDMRPTPELSFAVRELGCIAGINITASHNPKEYNGFKAYWEDGAQLSPGHSETVFDEMIKADIFDGVKTMPFDKAKENGLIKIIGPRIDERFLEKTLSFSINPEVVRKTAETFTVVYTPFHGAGRNLIPEALRRLGLKNIITVREQMIPDGNFPTVVSPNPEEKEGFSLAVRLAEKHNADIIIATDPDADRMGVLCSDGTGSYKMLSGNQIGLLLLSYIIEARRQKGSLPSNAAVISTIVSTLMTDAVCGDNNIALFKVLTGFKHIGEKMEVFEKTKSHTFLFAFEESYGYLAGDHIRDKDAVSSAVLFCEAAAYYSAKGSSVSRVMEEIYERYGHYREKTVNIILPGIDGADRIKKIMSKLRGAPPVNMGGLAVVSAEDYLNGTITNIESMNKTRVALPCSDVLVFRLCDGSAVAVRPSGTEPKIKIYILVKGPGRESAEQKLESLHNYVKDMQS